MQEQTQIQKDLDATKVFTRPSHDKLFLCPVGRCPFLAPSHCRFMPLLSPLKYHFQVILRQTINEILVRVESRSFLFYCSPFEELFTAYVEQTMMHFTSGRGVEMMVYTSGRARKKCVLQ